MKRPAVGGGVLLSALVAVLLGFGAVAFVHAGEGDSGGGAASVATLTRLLAEMETRADRLEEQLGERDRQLQEALLVRDGRAMREALSAADIAGPAISWSLNDAGLLMMAEGRMKEALMLFNRALLNVEQHFDPMHPARGTLLQNAGEVLLATGEAEASEAHFREAAVVFGLAVGDGHPRLAAVLNGWANALIRLQRYEDAETLYRRAILIYEQRKKPHSSALAVPLHNLAVMLISRGRAEEAGVLLEKALQVLKKSGEGESDAVLGVLRALVRQCRAVGALDQADRYEEEVGKLAVRRMEKAAGVR